MEKAGAYVKKLIINNGTEIDIQKNDIVIFVGTNNAGKSQCLNDINARLKSDVSTIVIKDVEIEKYPCSLRDTFERLGKDTLQENDRHYYSVRTQSFNFYKSSEDNWKTSRFIGDYRDVFIAKLDTENRLI